jgi:hypothetical protein
MVTITHELDGISHTTDNSADTALRVDNSNTSAVPILRTGNNRKAAASKQKLDKLASIRPTIAAQLPALQKVIEEFASSMLAKKNAVKTRIASLSKFEKEFNDKPFLPKCLNLKIALTSSKGLADDATTNLLRRELQNHVENFQRNATATLKRQAEAELSHAKHELAQNFIKCGLKLTKLYIACQDHLQTTPLVTNLGRHHFATWIFLRYLEIVKDDIGEPGFFSSYLHIQYSDMKELTLLAGTSGDTVDFHDSIRNRASISAEESSFACSVLDNLKKVIVPITSRLQFKLDDDELRRSLNSKLEAMLQSSGTLAATEATAQALLQERPIQHDTMQKLMTDMAAIAVNKALRQKQQNLPKNSPGGQKSPAAPPQDNRRKKISKKASEKATAVNKTAVSKMRKRAGVTFSDSVKQPTKKRQLSPERKDPQGGKKNEQNVTGKKRWKRQKQTGSKK